jgi:hypothetical protein
VPSIGDGRSATRGASNQRQRRLRRRTEGCHETLTGVGDAADLCEKCQCGMLPAPVHGGPMRDQAKDNETLSELNRNYVRSVDEADTAWFDANLAVDFLNTNPDGSLIDRDAFIAQIGRGSLVKQIREHDVIIRIFGDFAIIHARTAYLKPDGTSGAGRYTDDWLFRDGRWQCISAHVARL